MAFWQSWLADVGAQSIFSLSRRFGDGSGRGVSNVLYLIIRLMVAPPPRHTSNRPLAGYCADYGAASSSKKTLSESCQGIPQGKPGLRKR